MLLLLNNNFFHWWSLSSTFTWGALLYSMICPYLNLTWTLSAIWSMFIRFKMCFAQFSFCFVLRWCFCLWQWEGARVCSGGDRASWKPLIFHHLSSTFHYSRSNKLDRARMTVRRACTFVIQGVGTQWGIAFTYMGIGYGEARECVSEIIWYFPHLIASWIGIDSALSQSPYVYELNALLSI